MATIFSAKAITWALQTALFGLCVGAFLYAQSGKSELSLAGNTEGHLSKPYQNWIDEDVLWIATPEEKAAFTRLLENEERDHFVEQFWLRRDPTPGTPENEYKEEHYRRIAYSNVHFATGVAGFKTDRGRTYIVYGPPDEIRVQLGGDEAVRPTEIWRYQSIPGYGKDVDLRFVDRCNCGDYRLQTPSKN
jgi:GWxTD domain-containing protein